MRPIRLLAAACSIVLIALSFVVFGPVTGSAAPADRAAPCGQTTLDATIQDLNGDGVLECGKADHMVVRDNMAVAGSTRVEDRKHLLTMLLLADFQLGDEELTLPSRTDWRKHPAMLPHMLNAQLEAANRITAEGGPILGHNIDMAFALGDLADNAQYNEARLVVDIMDGGALVDPNSGGPGYEGNKPSDPRGAGDLRSPVQGERILDLAQEKFHAAGLHNADGSPIPWYAVHGNHDSKVMGHIPGEHHDWRHAADQWATGDTKVVELRSRLKTQLEDIRDTHPHDEPAFWMDIFQRAKTDPSSVGDVRKVRPDKDRRILSKEAWIEEFADTTGIPKYHGHAPDQRCPDVYPNEYARRACFAFDSGRFRFVALDDNALEGYTTGSIDRQQFAWLERQLIGASSSYFDEDGKKVTNPDAEDRYVIVFSHHTSKGMGNDGTKPGDGFDELQGEDLEKLLLRFPNAIVHANGHSHGNHVWPHQDRNRGTQYWEINTASVADQPHSGRIVEIADNGDGTLSIFGVNYESGVNPNPRNIDWAKDDPSDETAEGAKRTINEDWLAAAGIEEANTDRSPRRYGNAEDRDVELLLRNPILAAAVPASSDLGGDIQVLLAVTVAFGFVAWWAHRNQQPVPPVRPTRRPRTPPRTPVDPARQPQRKRSREKTAA